MSSGERVWARSTDLEILHTKWAARRVKMSSLGAEVRTAEWGLLEMRTVKVGKDKEVRAFKVLSGHY